jgi:UPF0716 protein FxsA
MKSLMFQNIRPAKIPKPVKMLLWVLPVIEVGLFILVAKMLGVFLTLVLLLVTSFLGGWLLRQQAGILQMGKPGFGQAGMPDPLALASAPIKMMAAVLLLLPGFFTDILGLILLTPAANKKIMTFFLKSHLKGFASSQNDNVYRPAPSAEVDNGHVIEGTFWKEDQ